MESWREELYSDSLSHHGIKGMKWGVRRYQNEDGTLTSAGKARRSDSSQRKKSDDPASMTDDQLKAAISRLRMEKEYSDLLASRDGRAAISAGKNQVKKQSNSVVSEILKSSAKAIGAQVITYALGTAVNAVASEYMKRRPNPLQGMSDEFLDSRIARMEKEKKYNDLLKGVAGIVNPKKGQKDK